MKSALPALVLMLLITAGHCVWARDGSEQPYAQSTGAEGIQRSLAAAREAAEQQDKLLLVVMGANWCHDSRAFVEYLADPGLSELIDARYVVQKVNVGYYENVRDVITPWDVPVIYGTPTVLVVEPGSNRLLNREYLNHWRNAASRSPSEAVEYFDDYFPGPVPEPEPPSPALAEALAEIDAFEREQAERIYLAYADVGADLRELGDERPGPEFMEKWDNLAAMRTDITRDLAELRAEARAQDAAGVTDIRLAYPAYALFID